jgi:hypothetical protein
LEFIQPGKPVQNAYVVRSGDLVWVEYQGRKARYRIVWVRDSDSDLKSQAAVQRLEKEECPWLISGVLSR